MEIACKFDVMQDSIFETNPWFAAKHRAGVWGIAYFHAFQ
jgi:hypothetical protein